MVPVAAAALHQQVMFLQVELNGLMARGAGQAVSCGQGGQCSWGGYGPSPMDQFTADPFDEAGAYGPQFATQYGPQFGSSLGSQFGPQFGSPLGPQYGAQFNPYGGQQALQQGQPNDGFVGNRASLITDCGGGDYDQPAGLLGLGTETVHGKGAGADLNGDGVSDGNLAFDYDHDGDISNQDIDETNKAIKAHNGEMEQTACNRNEVDGYKDKYNQIDSNGDGNLDSAEINAHGGKIAVDRGNGTFMIHDFNKYAA